MTEPNKHVDALSGMVEGIQEVQASVFNHIVDCLRDYLESVPPDQRTVLRRKFVASFALQMMFDEARKDQGVEVVTVSDAQNGSWAWCQDMAQRMCWACENLGRK